MKRANWVRLIAMILVISMLAAPVSAATFGGSGHSTNGLIGSIIGIIKDIIIEIIDDWFDIPGVGDPDPTEPPVPTTPEEPTAPSDPVATDPTEPEVTEPEETEPEVTEPEETEPEETEPEETEPAVETVLELVEDFSTVENGHLLRGTTYTLSQIVAQQPQTAPYALRSSSVSTFAVNSAAATAETTTTVSDTPLTITFDDNGNAIIPNGDYVAHHNEGTGSYLTVNSDTNNPWNKKTIRAAMDKASASYLTFTRLEDGTYTIQGPGKWYLCIPAQNQAYTQADSRAIKITAGSNGGIILTDTESELSLNALDYVNQYPKGRGFFGGYKDGSPLVLYAVTDGAPELPSTSKVVYFPVTMFNYDTDKLNVATINKELENPPEDHIFKGIYFSGGTPTSYVQNTGTFTETRKTVVTYSLIVPEFDSNDNITNLDTDSEYILVNKRQRTPVIDNGSSLNQGSAIAGAGSESTITLEFAEGQTVTELGGGSIWKYGTYTVREQVGDSGWPLNRPVYEDVTYPCILNTSGSYLTFGDDTGSVSGTQVATYIQKWAKDSNCVVIKQGNYYLSNLYGGNTNPFKGYDTLDDGGNPFYIYEKVSTETVTTNTPNTITYTYAGHNHFKKGTDDAAAGDLVWTGMAADQLDENENIVFNYPDGGIFSYDPDALDKNCFDGVKNVYEFVGMPFLLSERGVYTFDSDENGVHFKDTNGDGEPDPVPGSKDKFNNMQFNYGQEQDLPLDVADGSENGWFPYDIDTSSESDLTYHFGMRADLPFSMTANGRVKSTDDTSEEIIFRFSGDDDVWIYIDGQQVVDLGGMHNRLDIEIDFAANTVTYKEENDADTNNDTGSYNDPEKWKAVRKLFKENAADTDSLLPYTRYQFAANVNHELQFFYLERGRGTSNCRVEFNLPMTDTVSVTKVANESWSAEADEADGDRNDGTYPLTKEEQANVDQIPFGFTLYKKVAGATTFEPVRSTNYYLVDADGNSILDSEGNPTIGNTDENGHFFLKNGQTAKFMTEIPMTGVSYYVVEDKTPNGFLTPDFQFKGTATNGFDWYNAEGVKQEHILDASVVREQEIPMDWTGENKSYTFTAYGSVEATDSLEFICVNYLDAKLPNPSALAMEDIIVIDYGLPVQIDPLANDVFRGDSIEIVHYAVGDVNFTDEEGKISKEVGDALVNAEKNLTGVFGNFEFHPQDYSATFNEKGEITNVVRDTFSYALNKQLTEVEVLTYVVRVTGSKTQDATGITKTDYCYGQAKLYIVPATIMYYEENFNDLVHFEFLNGATAPTFEKEDAYISDYQEPGVVGNRNDSTYGSDVAYLSDPHDSNGTSYFFDTTNGAVRFWYTFTGTGTSFFARTSATTGYMQVLLFAGDQPGSAGQQQNTYYRDTYFYKGEDDHTKTHDDEPLYNIPVYTVDELPYGTYTVLVTVAKKGTKAAGPMHDDGFKRSMHEFYLDGIRVLQPLNGVLEYDEENSENKLIPNDRLEPINRKALDAYTTDNESNLDIVTLRNKLIDENYFPVDPESGEVEEVWPFVVLTDTNGKIIYASDYVSIGPKEEVYLAPGQKVRFSLKYWQPEGLSLYIGMKAPFGNGALVNVGKTPYSIGNATDCYRDVTKSYAYQELIVPEDGSQPYYVITYTFEVPADAKEVVSLTNIKVVGSHEFTILENEDFSDTDIEA